MSMLKINMEYRKGILFVRPCGNLTRVTYKCLNDYLLPVIGNQGIKYIVYNLGNVRVIDNKGKESLLEGINAVRKNLGEGIICNNCIKFENALVTEDELSAIKLIKI